MKKYLYTTIIILIAFLCIRKVYNSVETNYSYFHNIQDTVYNVLEKKSNQYGVREVVSGGRRRIGSYKQVHNTYMFIYTNGSIEEVDRQKYDLYEEGDTLKIPRYKLVDEDTFNRFQGFKYKTVLEERFNLKHYEVYYLNNKVLDTVKIR